MTHQQDISVVIPCYNGSRYLRETLESVLSQTHLPSEVIVVDDGSTDDSATIAESFGEPVRVIRQKNRGESVARNRGIEAATGEWIALLDADDLWSPEKTARQLEHLSTKDIACCSGTKVFTDGNALAASTEQWTPQACQLTAAHILRHGGPLHISSLLVRRTACPRFPHWTQYGEDAIFLLELLSLGNVAIVPEPLSYYRRHANNQSNSPEVPIRWFETFEQWLSSEAGNTAQVSLADGQQQLIAQLAQKINIAFWQRDWDQHQVLMDYMLRRQDIEWPEVKVRKLPKFAYSVKDSLERACGLSSSSN